VLLYGRNGWFAPALNALGFNVVFAFPGASVQHCTRHPRTALWAAPVLRTCRVTPLSHASHVGIYACGMLQP